MWINSETEQTREILRCMRCKQSYSSLPELTMHMVRSRHYAEIIYNSTPDGANSPKRRRPSQQSPQQQPQLQAQPPSPTLRQPGRPAVKDHATSNGAPAYLSPNLPPPPPLPQHSGRVTDNSPLSCLQRLVNETTAHSAADSFAAAAAVAAAASPSAASCASTSSTSDAASVLMSAAAYLEAARSPREPPTPGSNSAASTPPLPQSLLPSLRCPPPQQVRQQQQQHQYQRQHAQQQQQQSKKAKCQQCGKPFANKGQVRLHVSKGKCPAGNSAAAACFLRITGCLN